MKILFLQNTPDVIGGVEFVNKTLAEGLQNRGHRVGIYSMRLLGKNEDIGLSKKIDTMLISNMDLIDRPSNKLALQYFTHFRFIKFTRQMKAIVLYFLKMRRDYFRMRKAVAKYNADLIVVSYTYMLDVVPKKMLSRVVAHIHTSFQFHNDNRFVYAKLNQYKNRISHVVWATNSSAKLAKEAGIDNSISIYNPIKFASKESADVVNNKRVVYIGRISPEKQVDLIIKMFDEVVSKNNITDWCLDLFGSGEFNDESLKILQESSQIHHRGNTLDPKKELLGASVLMVASKYEAFSLAVFEANECGVPAIAFEFGEPTSEAIINGKTGIVVERENVEDYKRALYTLLTDANMRLEYSENAKIHAKSASLNTVLDQWKSILLDRN